MSYEVVIRLASEALTMCVLLSLPAVITSAAVGLGVSFIQAVTSLQDASISQGVKLLTVTIVVLIAAPWAGATMMRFFDNIFNSLFL